MNIIKLAKECGSESDNRNDDRTTFEFDIRALAQFAAAIIENYKAGLVPVAWMWYDKPNDEKVYSDDNSPKPSTAILLYTLPLGETK